MNEVPSPFVLHTFNRLTRDMVEHLMRQTLETGRCLQFDIERINRHTHTAEVLFRIRFGYFGFQVNRLTSKKPCSFPDEWGRTGRGVDIGAFLEGWSQLGVVSINNLSIRALKPFVYSRPRLSTEPMVYDKDIDVEWTSVLVVRHRFAFREVLPICHTDEGSKLGRWYNIGSSECPQWNIEWVSVEPFVLQRYSREEIRRDLHMPAYPLQIDQELVSEFLSASEPYLPCHCPSVLTATQLRQQLYDALWCTEARHRLVPRYTKDRLWQWVNTLRIERAHFAGPQLETAMTTTEILRLYKQRGSPIVQHLLHRSPNYTEATMSE